MSSDIDILDPEVEAPVTLDEDDRLDPDFVRSVLDAVEQGRPEEAYALAQPLHAADIADLFELTPRDDRAVSGHRTCRFDERRCARGTQRLCS